MHTRIAFAISACCSGDNWVWEAPAPIKRW